MLQRKFIVQSADIAKRVWHLTAISNLSQILGAGQGLLAKDLLQFSGVAYQDISMQGVQQRRQQRWVFGYTLHQYVPLFFCQRNPMMCFHQTRAAELVWLEIDVSALSMQALVTSNGNAACAVTEFQRGFVPSLPDWQVLTAATWNDAVDGKRKRAAELLCLGHVPAGAIRSLQVVGQVQRQQLVGFGLPVTINPRAFFC
ncbi:DarT ssDNA thymidine ADP-ribosyltransferase family protein [Rheinheimera sp.]|uniref:DarT ssDNA thymidine ADP-ribosyltransferase family protein n=1 Tax=Rheinheimera sp. TaxID=1869214 RepID=UPI003AF40D84